MSDQYVAEIRVFPFDFAPYGWALCQGQLVPISTNTALFSLLGTNYGGDGRSTFGLPNLQGQVPVSQGQGPARSGYVVGETAGAANVTLTAPTMATHNHGFMADTADGGATGASGNQLAKAVEPGRKGGQTANLYNPATPNTAMSPQAIGLTGGGQGHNNVQPYLAMNYCIALTGVFPPRP